MRRLSRIMGTVGAALPLILLTAAPGAGATAPSPVFERAPTDAGAFPGANGVVAFRGWDGDYEIFVVNNSGGGLTQLTFNTASDGDPAFSPNGAKIAWSSDGDIWRMRADGSGQRQVTNTAAAEYEVDWSPNGKQLVVVRDTPKGNQLFVMRANGTHARRITQASVAANYPSWSPDGSRILYGRQAGGTDQVFSIKPDGKQNTRLTFGETAYPGSWHPNGRKILFFAYPMGEGDYEIFRMSRKGQNLQQITTNTWNDQDVVYSPDGSRMAWVDNLDGDYEVVQALVSAPAGATQLTFNASNDYGTNWQPV